MAKTSKAAAPESACSEYVERLTDAINRMTDELRVARDVMDEIREDLGWVTRNGIPGHQDGPTQLLRMARNPLAPDANERIEFRLNQGAANSSAFSPEKFDELVSEIAEIVTVVGQEATQFAALGTRQCARQIAHRDQVSRRQSHAAKQVH